MAFCRAGRAAVAVRFSGPRLCDRGAGAGAAAPLRHDRASSHGVLLHQRCAGLPPEGPHPLRQLLSPAAGGQRHQSTADADRLHPRQKPGKPAALRQRARHSGAEQGSPGADHAGGQRRSGLPVDRRRGTAGRQRHAQHRLQRHQLLHPSGREYHLHRQQDPDHQPKYPPALKNQRGQCLYRCGGGVTDHR